MRQPQRGLFWLQPALQPPPLAADQGERSPVPHVAVNACTSPVGQYACSLQHGRYACSRMARMLAAGWLVCLQPRQRTSMLAHASMGNVLAVFALAHAPSWVGLGGVCVASLCVRHRAWLHATQPCDGETSTVQRCAGPGCSYQLPCLPNVLVRTARVPLGTCPSLQHAHRVLGMPQSIY